MNQNHLHLHVNVTNSDFRSYNKTSARKSNYSDSETSGLEMGHIKGLESSRNKTFSKDKLVLKKNNVQYTPLTINAILKDHSGPETKQRNRIKTKSGDLSSI